MRSSLIDSIRRSMPSRSGTDRRIVEIATGGRDAHQPERDVLGIGSRLKLDVGFRQKCPNDRRRFVDGRVDAAAEVVDAPSWSFRFKSQQNSADDIVDMHELARESDSEREPGGAPIKRVLNHGAEDTLGLAARSVDGGDAQDNAVDAMFLRIAANDGLAGDLARGVATSRQQRRVFRDFVVGLIAIDGEGRTKHETACAPARFDLPGELRHVDGSPDVDAKNVGGIVAAQHRP